MITLAFFVSLLYLYFVLFFDAKSTLSDAFLVSFGFGTVLFFGASCRFPPVLLDGGHHREVVRFVKMLRYPLVSCRYLCIFCKRMHLQYIEAFLGDVSENGK